MKKLLCIMLCFAMIFVFAACGGAEESSTGSSNAKEVAPTSLKFNSQSYTVAVEGYNALAKDLVVEPEGAKVYYSVSDTSIATIDKKGEVTGVKSGEVTVTAASADGSVKAECKLEVVGYGSVTAGTDEEGDVGITNKRVHGPERNPDPMALIVLIPKDLPEGTDMSNAVIDRYYAPNEVDELEPTNEFVRNKDGFFTISVNGYFVARTNEECIYRIDNVPEGDYDILIVSGKYDYARFPEIRDYSKRDTLGEFSATDFAKHFTADQINSIVSIIGKREYLVGELTVKTGETTIFGAEFQINSYE